MAAAALLAILISFAGTYYAMRRSPVYGLICLLIVGYFYGILRANLQNAFSHFIFDAALAAFYWRFPWKQMTIEDRTRTGSIRTWTWILMFWPILLAFVPLQPLPVTIVGLRGALLFLPMLCVGSRLASEDVRRLATALAVLNVVALLFALAEYQIGLERFYPKSAVTWIMYRSVDGAGRYRIPAIFTSAHAFGGMMVDSLPLLLNGWTNGRSKKARVLMLIGIAAAMAGILLSSTRLNFVLGGTILVVTLLTSRMGAGTRFVWVSLLLIAAAVALNNDRFSRFKQLDSSTVSERVAGSVNASFFDILYEYPLGNGLGGGGTSMPYFLQGMISHPMQIENEYGRILLEQGLAGLLLWLAFIVWYLLRRTPFAASEWKVARRSYWVLYLVGFGSASIGVGLLTNIPGSYMMLLMMGWYLTPPARANSELQPPSTHSNERDLGSIPQLAPA